MQNTALKKITIEAKKIRKSNPKIKWTDAIKKASAKIKNAKKTVGKKTVAKKTVGKVVKKTATKKPISQHKDTKSHNVNIRVVSGSHSDSLKKYQEITKDILNYEDAIKRIKLSLPKMTSTEKKRAHEVLRSYRIILAINKKKKTEIKKLL